MGHAAHRVKVLDCLWHLTTLTTSQTKAPGKV